MFRWWRRWFRRKVSRVLIAKGVDRDLVAECPMCHATWVLLKEVGSPREYDLTPDCPKGPH